MKRQKELYKGLGVDAEQALEALGRIPISMHCWQGMTYRALRTTARFPAGYRPPEITPARPAPPTS